MKLLLIISLLLATSCSMIKSKTDRCFDLFEQYGKVNMSVIENNHTTFRCTDEIEIRF